MYLPSKETEGLEKILKIKKGSIDFVMIWRLSIKSISYFGILLDDYFNE